MKLKKIISIFVITVCTGLISFSYGQNDSIQESNDESNTETITEIKFNNDMEFGDGSPVSGINLPRMDTEGFEGDEPIILAKEIVYKIIELLPFIIFIMLLLGCFHMIVSIKDGEGKKGARIIKQVIVGTILFIISIYVLNIVSIYLTGSPVLSTSRIFHTYIGGTNYGL